MKKNILLSAFALAAASMSLQAQDASEIRVYINPGHGSWTPNDRPCTLVGHGAYSRTNTDTLSFFESNTNLRKGFGLLEALVDAGFTFDRTLNQEGDRASIGAARDMENNIVMSHVKCGPYHDDNGTENQLGAATPADIYAYNRLLGEICEEVDANNFDYFISIHSNAATEGTSTNYPLFLYRGYDTPADGQQVPKAIQQTSRAMSTAAWPYAYGNTHAQWTAYSATNANIRGDVDFYHGGSTSSSTGVYGYLGVLKHHSPGYLVEGYFHTYQPARHRAMNWDVCRLEGNAYARGLLDYLGLEKQTTGTIYGVIRDKNTKFKDAAYSPNPSTPDAYMPLNGVKVILKKDGVQIAEYTTDNYYNGAFVFNKLAPGKYTIETQHDQYLAMEQPLEVEVKAHADVYPTISLVDKDWTPPTVVYTNYPDVVVPGTVAADEYEFSQDYIDNPVAELEGKTVRRAIAHGENLYILAHDAQGAATILVYDAVAKTVLANVSTAGMTGYVKAVSDIQVTADGVLVATNESFNQYSDAQVDAGMTRGKNTIYRWANDEKGIPTGDPIVMGQSMLSGNFYRATVGHSMAYSGTLAEGKIVVPCVNASSGLTTHKIFYNNYTIVDGEIASAGFNNKSNDQLMTQEILGNDFTFTTSPLNADNFVVTGLKTAPVQFAFNNVVTDIDLMEKGMADGSSTVGFYRYDNHAYMVTAENTPESTIGFRLTDITDGLANAKSIGLINTSVPAEGLGAVAASLVPVLDPEENITGAYMNFYLVRNGKISRLSTKGVEVKAHANPLAYALKLTQGDANTYTIEFKSTQDVADAAVIFTNVADENDVIVKPVAVDKGSNTLTVDANEFTDGASYHWAVQLKAKTNPVAGEYFADASGAGATRGSVITFTDPQYDSFGYVLTAHGKNQGIDVYDPEGNKVQNKLFKGHAMFGGAANTNQSDPFRGNELRGEAVLATWGDKGYGAVRVNPLNPDQQPETLFAGEKEASGNFVYNGLSLGGGTAGICFVGEGENTVMYSFSEDHPSSIIASNNIVRYKVGSGWQITEQPTAIGYGGRLANTNVDLISYGNGFFATQVRNAGNNNTGAPGFIYVEAENHQEVYNSGVLLDAETNKVPLTGCNSGVAISHDGKTLAAFNGDGSKCFVYNVTWDGNKPSLTYSYNFATPSSIWNTARFDYAGNLHVYHRDRNGYHAYALVNESPVVTVPAKDEFMIKGSSAVEDIAVDNSDNEAPAVFYNLQGIQMDPENLVPGVYIKVQGKKSTKVIVK